MKLTQKAEEAEAQYRRQAVHFLKEVGQKLRLCVPRPATGLSGPDNSGTVGACADQKGARR